MSSYRRGFHHGLMFHRFRSCLDEASCQGALTPEEFERVLLYVGLENILAPNEWLSRLEENRLGENDLCVTFDDGLRCQVEHALPVLERHGLRAFWFVYSCVFDNSGIIAKSEIYSHAAAQLGGTTPLLRELLRRCPSEMRAQLDSPEFAGYAQGMREVAPFYSLNDIKYRFLRDRAVDKHCFESLMDDIIKERGVLAEVIVRRLWLDNLDLKVLSANDHVIGLHSYDHPYRMAELGCEAQREQYLKNFSHIESVTNIRPVSMSHPLNSYNTHLLNSLNALGIKCGFRATVMHPAGGAVNPNHLELAREDGATLARRSAKVIAASSARRRVDS